MKQSGKAITGPEICYLAAGVFCFLLMATIPRLQGWIGTPEHLTERFQRALNERAGDLHERIQQTCTRIATDRISLTWDSLSPLFSTQSDLSCTVMVYEADSLVFWTDNRISLPSRAEEWQFTPPALVRLADGWYLVDFLAKDSLVLAGCFLVKHEYPFQNQYLKNQFAQGFPLPAEVEISLEPGDYGFYFGDSKRLGTLRFPDSVQQSGHPYLMLFLLLLGYLFLTLFLDSLCYRKLQQTYGLHNLWMVSILLVALLRFVQWSCHWPAMLYDTPLFGPGLFAVSRLFPSLGDLLINSFLLMVGSFLFFFRWETPRGFLKKFPSLRRFKALTALLFSLIVLLWVMGLIRSLVIHSAFPMNLEHITRFNTNSLIAFLSTGFLLVSWVLVTVALSGNRNGQPAQQDQLHGRQASGWLFTAMVLVSVAGTLVLHHANQKRDRHQRDLIALRLGTSRNPVTENRLRELVQEIHADNHFRLLCSGNTDKLEGTDEKISQPGVQENQLNQYILQRFFARGWNNYAVQITQCLPDQMLNIQPQGYLTDCSGFFQEMIRLSGKQAGTNVWFLDYGDGSENYLLALLPKERGTALYIEIGSRTVAKDAGYPELLVDRETYDFPDIDHYVYARYNQGRLVYRMGSFAYGNELSVYVDTLTGEKRFLNDGMEHFFYPLEDSGMLIIGKNQNTWLNVVFPFSYLFLFLLVLMLVGLGIANFRRMRGNATSSLRNRLQIIMLGMFISAFLIIGILTVFYLMRLNTEKNEENLLQRAMSLLIEMEHKFNRKENLAMVNPEELEMVLVKFSNVFFSDINLYRPDGFLLASTRSRIFEEGLVSNRINREAFDRLHRQTTGMFVLNERIGTLDFMSAYVPVYNTSDVLLGYINLPYFSRQDDLKREISAFLVAFLNLYVLFALIGAGVIYLISNYITYPLTLLAQHIGRIRIGHTEEQLSWERQDEIGHLVREYNRMLGELALSAEKLAISERQSAWREMAKQVAHEIKNPLTPMKLSVQYLKKAWEEGAPDWDQRLTRFTESLIEQIDSLSAIASEFSYFARMPEPERELLDLDELVVSALNMYSAVSDIRFTFEKGRAAKRVLADRRQLLRVLTNLINNAIHALDGVSEGQIRLETSGGIAFCRITVTDNGKGIRPEEAGRIFQPNFTTRSGGTGLGLAIVKGIIDSMGGTILFSSEAGRGTVFVIDLPEGRHTLNTHSS